LDDRCRDVSRGTFLSDHFGTAIVRRLIHTIDCRLA